MKVAEELIDLIQDTPATKTYKPRKKRAGNHNLADVLMTRPGKEKKNIHMSHFQTKWIRYIYPKIMKRKYHINMHS